MKIQPVEIVGILDAKDPGPEFVTLLSRLSRSYYGSAQALEIELCSRKLICVS